MSGWAAVSDHLALLCQSPCPGTGIASHRSQGWPGFPSVWWRRQGGGHGPCRRENQVSTMGASKHASPEKQVTLRRGQVFTNGRELAFGISCPSGPLHPEKQTAEVPLVLTYSDTSHLPRPSQFTTPHSGSSKAAVAKKRHGIIMPCY